MWVWICEQFFTLLNMCICEFLTIYCHSPGGDAAAIRHFIRYTLYSVTRGRQCNGLGGVYALVMLAALGSEFGEQPGNTEAVSGEDVTLPCAAPRGEPAPRVRWSKNNAPLKPDTDRVSVLQSGSLRLRDVRRQDAGNYVCIAYNIGGERNSNAARLTVRGLYFVLPSLTASRYSFTRDHLR